MSTAQGVKVDPKDPNVRKLVYNMYRGILGNYNGKANDILSTLPKERVVEDQGITKQLESMIRQQSQISGGNSAIPTPTSPISVPNYDSPPTFAPPAPPPPPPLSTGAGIPPPPPPIGLVHIPAVRLKSEIPDVRREPPAAIQNAMMKDKKPFTYTPGGLDLSEIRSPRMQRRISRNAQTTDDTSPNPPIQHAQPPRPVSLPPSAAAAMQPQIAIPVFPQGSAGFPNHYHPMASHAPPPPPPPSDPYVNNFQPPPPPPQPMAVPKTQPQRQQQNQNTGSIYVPPVQQSHPRSQLGSLYIPPVHNQQQDSPTPPPISTTPVAQLNKAPTPWLSRQPQPQKEVPPWVNRENGTPSPVTSPQIQNNQKPSSPQQQTQTRIIPIQIEGREQGQQGNTRIIPIKIEGSSSPQHNINQPNYQQSYPQQQNQQYQQQQQQQQQQQRWPVYVHNKYNPSPSSPNDNSNVTNGRVQQQSQQNWGNSTDGSLSPAPVQSRSFRVLQKITDTDAIEGDQVDAPYNSQGVPLSQLRKLQLSDDDRALMNKVKSQDTIFPVDEENPRYRGGYIPSRVFKALDESVDEDNFLHTEAEPRYRGAAIPSRAFRMLQNMTDNPGGMAGHVPHGPNDNQARSVNRRPQQEPASPAQPYVHPSEQQVQEPRMYTGAAIPSRSFRMLQAMTGPDPSGSQMCQSGSENNNNVEGGWPSNPYQYDPNYYFYFQQQSAEEQQQFWNHYNAMCAYMAEMNAAAQRYSPYPHPYSPQHFAPPLPPLPTQYYSDNEEYSGYSSTEEMSRYYHQPYFHNYPPSGIPFTNNHQYQMQPTTPVPDINITPTNEADTKVYIDESSDAERDSDKNESTPVPLSETGESEESTSGSDTEVEEDNDKQSPTGLQTIKSVPNINIYKNSSSSAIQTHLGDEHANEDDDDEDEVECPDDDDDDEEEEEEHGDDDSSVHQLSVIYEESEHSDVESMKKKSFDSHNGSIINTTTSEDDSSTTTLDNGDDTDDDDNDINDLESNTVMVRLPLKLKFSKSENNEEVTTVIVGNSEVEAAPEVANKSEGMIIEAITKDDYVPDVSVTISLKKAQNSAADIEQNSKVDDSKIGSDVVKEVSEREKSPIDFWKTLNGDEQIEVADSCSPCYNKDVLSTTEDEEVKLDESDGHWEDDSSSTSVQTVRTGPAVHAGSGSEVDTDIPDGDGSFYRTSPVKKDDNVMLPTDSVTVEDEDSSDEDSSCSDSSSSDDSDSEQIDEQEPDQMKAKCNQSMNSNNNVPIKKVECSAKDNCQNNVNSRIDPSGSHEDSEEDDSGVTSDMSRHISETDTDPECGSELRKLSRYQRAATHSRLFKLLQDECAQEDEIESANESLVQNMNDSINDNVSLRKERLTLPLNNNNNNINNNNNNVTNEPDSLSSSSGVNSPSSPTVNDRLVKELVQSLLKRKKGRNFRKLPVAKLHAAALRILQEDIDQYDTTSTTSDENSPSARTMTDSQAVMMGQADDTAIANQNAFFNNNYYDYCQYYSSWGYPMYYGINDSLGHDIMPSKAFRLLQEHATSEKLSPGLIEGLTAKCPKVFSSGNIPKDLASSSPLPDDITLESTPSTET